MLKYIMRRLLQAIPTFFGITLLSYFIMVIAPGDPVSLLGFSPDMKQEDKERLAIRLGTNDPVPLQYLRWLIGDDWMQVDTNGDGELDSWGDNYGILRLDFGTSFKFKGSSPLTLIGERIGASIELNVAVLLVGVPIGIFIGVLAAVYRGQLFDNTTRIVAVLGDSIPTFWVGMMAIIFFGIILPRFLFAEGIGDGRPLLPMGGRCPNTRGDCLPIFLRLDRLLLPTLVSSLGVIASYSRFMRASMLETINKDFMRTARAKGLTEKSIWFKHGLRNAFIPFTIFLGPTLVGLIGGSVIIERVFTWPGIGLLLFESVVSRDYPVIMASVVIGAVLTIIGYIISDVLYAVFDPRVRF